MAFAKVRLSDVSVPEYEVAYRMVAEEAPDRARAVPAARSERIPIVQSILAVKFCSQAVKEWGFWV